MQLLIRYYLIQQPFPSARTKTQTHPSVGVRVHFEICFHNSRSRSCPADNRIGIDTISAAIGKSCKYAKTQLKTLRWKCAPAHLNGNGNDNDDNDNDDNAAAALAR